MAKQLAGSSVPSFGGVSQLLASLQLGAWIYIHQRSSVNQIDQGSSHLPSDEPAPAPISYESLLECGICCDYLAQPRETMCCHALFCFKCLQEWHDASPTCPACRAAHQPAKENIPIQVSFFLSFFLFFSFFLSLFIPFSASLRRCLCVALIKWTAALPRSPARSSKHTKAIASMHMMTSRLMID